MATSSTPSALVVVTAELVAQPAAIARLKEEFSGFDVHQQLLERLEENAVQLPAAKYTRVHVASGVLSIHASEALFASMRNNAEITGDIAPSRTALTITGYVPAGEGRFVKKEVSAAPVQLKRRTVPQAALGASAGADAGASTGAGARPLRRFAKASDATARDTDEPAAPLTPPGDTDDIIDEDELVEGFDARPAIVFPAKCDPGPGKKRRRACKDCTCGLKEQEEEEAQSLESSRAVLLDQDEMAEIDFTVPGKAVGGCGSCALGDAFRCDGCPYIGLPPFKPGEVVSLDQYGDDF